MGTINAVILAGDGKKGAVQQGVKNKALLPIHGKPMVAYVVDALKSAPSIGQISIIGPVDLLKEQLGDRVDFYIEDKESLFENLNSGIGPFMKEQAVLVVTSDIPMITGDMVEDFIGRCQQKKGDLCYPIVEKSLNEAKFPGVERTYVRLKEATYTGGNIIYVNPAVVKPCEDFAKKMIAYRKKPWMTAKLVGVGFLIRLLLGKVTIAEVEKRFSKLLRIHASAIVTPYPEVGNDVDKPSDMDMVQKHFQKT